MSEAKNYARHVGNGEVKGTGMLVFFRDTPPMAKEEWCEWAFWECPTGSELHLFRGKLVAEDDKQRAARRKRY